MIYSRSFILMLGIPVIFLMVLAVAIFGGQVIADSHRDHDIQQAIATQVAASSEIELLKLREVQYGYRICGLYRTTDSQQEGPFFYDTVNERLTLDVNAEPFQAHCNS